MKEKEIENLKIDDERFARNIDVLVKDVLGHDDFAPCEIGFLFTNKGENYEERVCKWIEDRKETFGDENFPFKREDLTFDVIEENGNVTLVVKIIQDVADKIMKIAKK